MGTLDPLAGARERHHRRRLSGVSARRVAEEWAREGIAGAEGFARVAAATFEALERAHDVQLPASFRELWGLADGTNTPDRHDLIFLQSCDLLDPMFGNRDGDAVELMFADWRQAMASFVVRFARASPGAPRTDHGVFVIGNRREPLAASFDAFLALYLLDEPLWPRLPSWR